ncbi:RBBP9/YdeN family alpha/beta hydrolase [Leifsonia sp. NPDC014704]|uniref:RBBP9/YdeN family alpha/beta hydrolase n=1 Tax=Leifsonia sp. NPDC014704 TaxID=3364123 RepID=UPI0036F462BC
MRTVIVPGIGGSDSEHWQSIWESRHPEMRRIEPSSWDEPDAEDWSGALDRAVDGGRAILVAHSLGCLLAVRWSHLHPENVAGLFLVAAPDPAGPRFPREAESFSAGLDVTPAVPVLMINSDDDPYCSPERAEQFAAQWGAASVSLGARGHLNSASRLGGWDEGANLLTAFTAGIQSPPRPGRSNVGVEQVACL